MEAGMIVALIFFLGGNCFIFCFCCYISTDDGPRETETEEEVATEADVTLPSAPSAAPAGQTTFENTALEIEENEQDLRELNDLPPAYGDLFVKTIL